MTITPNPSTIRVGESIQLHSASGAKWNTANPDIATAKGSGLVTGIAPGTATIIAKKGNQRATGTVLVILAPQPQPPDPPIPPEPLPIPPDSNFGPQLGIICETMTTPESAYGPQTVIGCA